MKKNLENYPQLKKEFHPSKNGKLKPKDFTRGSSKKVWWLCLKGHEYFSQIKDRTKRDKPHGCPFCAGKRAHKEHNLLLNFPDIASEWHPTKNDALKPQNVTHATSKKVWWLCPKGHTYLSRIAERTRKGKPSGCPKCSNQSSKPEIRILSELTFIFDEVISRYKFKNVEIDIYVPQINLGIEYDGYYFHKNNETNDIKKNKFFESKNIKIIRIREYPLKKITDIDVIIKKDKLTKISLNLLLKKIRNLVNDNINKKIVIYLKKKSFLNEKLFKKYLSYFPSPFPEKSLKKTNPELIKEWNYKKNFPLKPENFSHASVQKIWWLCPKGHTYLSRIAERTRKGKPSGCPYCSDKAGPKKTGKDNNLLFKFPDIASEWHPTKNNKTPENIYYSSRQKAWWLCSKGHEYYQRITNRTKLMHGCPFCSGRYASKENNLLLKFPDIAAEWHPTKNGKKNPEDFTHGSKKKVWWLCPKGHDYLSNINNRTSFLNCPFCWNKKRIKNLLKK